MFNGNTVVITGAAGALGRVVAQEFAQAGARVVGIDRPASLESRPLPPDITSLGANILDASEVAQAVERIRESHGNISGLLCLAGGFYGDTPVLETPVDAVREQFELNYVTAFTTITGCLPLMLEGGGGSIVCVSSRPAVTTVEGSVAYASSKLAVLKLIDLLAAEYRSQGVRANAIMPSIIDTPANREAMSGADFAAWVTPREIAAVLKFLVSDDASIVSGAHIPVYGRA